VAEAKPEVVTLDVGGPQISLRAEQVHVDDIARHAPKTGNEGEDLRRRGLLYLYAGQMAKAKEHFAKAGTAGFHPAEEGAAGMAALQRHLDRIAALELGEVEAGALRAWDNAEKLFAARNFKDAREAYGAFVQAHSQAKTYAAKAEALKERQTAIDKVLGPASATTVDLGGDAKVITLLDKTNGWLTNWEVAGPCTQEGKEGDAVFDVVFPAEKPDAPAGTWKALKDGIDQDHPETVDFARTSMFGEHRAAYLRTRVFSPKALPARFEASSDDGIKIWLNGKVVHSNNVMRSMSKGVDRGEIELKEGWNNVMVKVTQGIGDWTVQVRLVSRDGQRLNGVKIDSAGK
jgi:hypothetical protein